MTIRDIAKQAGVSPATVSRIMNHQDENISRETRERVLAVVKESGYVPYAKLREKLQTNSNVIGLAVPTLDTYFYTAFASEIQNRARLNGYMVMLSITGGTQEGELRTLEEFSQSKVEAVLFFARTEAGLNGLNEMKTENISAVILDSPTSDANYPQIYRDVSRTAALCTGRLLDACGRIALLLRNSGSDLLNERITEACRKEALSKNTEPGAVLYADREWEQELETLIECGTDGIICQDAELAGAVYRFAAAANLQIPGNLSVIALEDGPLSAQLIPAVCGVHTDAGAMADSAMEALLWQTRKKTPGFVAKTIPSEPVSGGSISQPRSDDPCITIIGSMNMDVVLQVPHIPQSGELQMASRLVTWPGGKGANQALCVSRLGGSAAIIGNLGNDRHGRQIFDQLNSAQVDLKHVGFVSDCPTGTAYITVGREGNNTIVVHAGANEQTTPDYIGQCRSVIRRSAYCLVQMEIPMPTVCETAALCRRYGVDMILKPAPARELPDELLKGLYMLVPNEEEAAVLCPGELTTEERAQALFERGVRNVIITLGEKGCVWMSDEGLRRYQAHDYPCIDSTGASDIFISCLTVLLTEGRDMDGAIRGASWAASYSVAHAGVQNAVPDAKLLNNFMHSIPNGDTEL